MSDNGGTVIQVRVIVIFDVLEVDYIVAKNYQTVSPSTILRSPVHFLAFGFGTGLAKKAPGTWGTLAAVPIYLAISSLHPMAYLAITVLVCGVGVWLCAASSKALGVHDHPGIVWDEIAGFLITMIAVPASWFSVILGFALFRLFDIWKPWPISWLDRNVHGGMGIMLDDIVAGIFAGVVLQIVLFF